MSYCKTCGGTGVEINGKYCECGAGDIKRASDDVKEKFDALKGKKKKRRSNVNKLVDDVFCEVKADKYQRGDWVVIDGHYNEHYNGSLCEVMDLDAVDNELLVKPKGPNSKGIQLTGRTWIDCKYIKPAPLDLTAEDQEALKALFVDLSLRTKDKKWFEELGGIENGF